MKNCILKIILFTILFTAQRGVSQSVCNTSKVSFTPIQNQEFLSIKGGGNSSQPIQLFIQFQEWPSLASKTALEQLGIQLIHPQPNKVYLVSLLPTVNLQQLKQHGAEAYLYKQQYHKLNCALWDAFLEDHQQPLISVAVFIDQKTDLQTTLNKLKSLHYTQSVLTHKSNEIRLQIDKTYLNALIDLSYIASIEPVFGAFEPFNFGKGRHGIYYVQTIEGLTGEGVTVGVGDNGKFDHLDGRNRTINNVTTNSTHGNNICGLIAGGGIIDPQYQGYAPKSKIITERYDDIIDNASLYHASEGMAITNNAYGTPTCSFNGWYSSASKKIDVLNIQEPYILHVFAAGNGGFNNVSCGFEESGFGSVAGGFQSSKNAITVGNLFNENEVHPSSSKGPTRDGRLKPEICARGHEAVAPGRNNQYNLIGGTSAASTAVSGSAAILIEQYRKQHNTNPPSCLLKSVLCNSADDLGNPGPDFTFGFGQLNLVEAVKCIRNNQYFLSDITNGQSKNRYITVPAGINQLKVNLYWNDVAGPIYSTKTLVDDLDLEILGPNTNGSTLPLVLDPTLPDKFALPGRDSINNVEQVVIPNPVPGSYVIRVKGTSIASTQVDFAVSYSFVSNDVLFTNPVQGSTLVPGEVQPIFWNSPEDCFPIKLEYSSDNGNSWKLIKDNIDATSRTYNWVVPNDPSHKTKLRLTQGGKSSESDIFNIYYQTTVRAYNHCDGSAVRVEWDTVPLASQYEVWLLDVSDSEMRYITTVQENNYVYPLAAYQANKDLWFSVIPLGSNGQKGKRSIAVLPLPEVFEELADYHYTSNLLAVDFKGFARPPAEEQITYNWQFGDGAFATGQQVTHNYLSSGQYYVKLTVLTSCAAYTTAKTIYISDDTTCIAQDSLELIKLYHQTDGPNWVNPWTLTDPVRSWSGVYLTQDKCNINILQLSNRGISGKVPDFNLPRLTILNLANNNLTGHLPEYNLPELENIYLSNNSITDTLPHFYNCPILKILSLDNNKLSGTIPSFNLPDLQLLLLNTNALAGSLPSFTNTANLTTLNIAENKLTGVIPDFNLPLLENLHLNTNQLTGQIPLLDNIPEIQYLYLEQNQLDGTLPNLLNCPSLVVFYAHSNKLTGSIPNYSNAFITSLYLYNNQLTGQVPNFSLPLLQNLYLNNNKLSGQLPALDSIPSISRLYFSDNQLGGSLPDFNNVFLTYLLLQNNKFTGAVPDLSGLTQLIQYSVFDNNLTFSGMLENKLVVNDFQFAPQYKIPVFKTGNEFNVIAGGDLSKNTYEWYRDGELISTKTGDSTFLASLPGTYYCKVTNTDLTDYQEHLKSLVLFSEDIVLENRIQFNFKVLLEGSFDPILNRMDAELFNRSLLRGQVPGSTVNAVSGIPSAHPYQALPWNYYGSEGGSWTAANYAAISAANGNKQFIDWVLVSIRTQPNPESTIARTPALLFRDGSLYFPNENFIPSKFSGPFYVLIEHRNHIGVMTPQPINVVNDSLTFDFTLQDSYVSGLAFGSKEILPDLFAMYAGEGYNTGLKVSYDINGNDKSLWLSENGFFNRYIKGDFNLDGDVNGADRILWDRNNGIYSSVRRYYP